MKTKSFIVAACMLVCYLWIVQMVAAQPRERETTHRQPTLSPEKTAERKTDILRKELNLTDKQDKKVYKLYLNQAKKAASAGQGQGSDSSHGMNGGSGRPGGGMGMPGGGGGNPGGMGGRPGNPPGGGGEMGMMEGERPNRSPGNRTVQYTESEKDIAQRDKKMKKILAADQYAKWSAWERRELSKETVRIWEQDMKEDSAPQAAARP